MPKSLNEITQLSVTNLRALEGKTVLRAWHDYHKFTDTHSRCLHILFTDQTELVLTARSMVWEELGWGIDLETPKNK